MLADRLGSFLFGVGEAGAFPGIAKVVYAWIPVQERGLVKGINFSGSRIGAAMILSASMMLDWQADRHEDEVARKAAVRIEQAVIKLLADNPFGVRGSIPAFRSR